MFKVTRISKLRGGKKRIKLDDGSRLDWPGPVVTACGVEEGDEVEKSQFEIELRKISGKLLPEAARNHLARYLKTSSQFINHFIRKGYPPEQVKNLVEPLQAEGFLNDEEVAREHITRRCRTKPRGRRKIIAELQKKGIDSSTARRLVYETISDEKEQQMARRYYEKNKKITKSKLVSRLKSRGFPGQVIHSVVEEHKQGTEI